MLWLLWFAGFLEIAHAFAPLSRQAEAIAHAWLDHIERWIFTIVLARAAPYLTPKGRRSYGPRYRRVALRRALMGSRLRRALRAKDICERAAALAADINDLVAAHIRRLARGLTRLCPIAACPDSFDPAPAFACADVCMSDTS